MYTLYDYFRSTASYRVRIVFELKQLVFTRKEVHLVNNGGDQFSSGYFSINPQQLVPALYDEEHQLTVSQSLAIIDYLESMHPTPSVYTNNPQINAQIKSAALSICCDMHPLNNLRVLNYLKNTLKRSEQEKLEWYHHWLHEGFGALETGLNKIKRQNLFCFSDKITLADICLIPQMYNAHRFNMDLVSYPLLNDINQYCQSLLPFQLAAP